MTKKTYKLRTGGDVPILRIDYAAELNQEQLSVVKYADGQCLVLAGAGSGKTRTLVYRVAWLLEHSIKPEHILLMTFTNKAAKEMASRVEVLLNQKPKGLWAGTFHHIGNRILRQYIHKLGYNNNYTIADEEDAKDLLKQIIGEKNYQKDKYFPKAGVIKNIISFSVNSGLAIADVFADKFSYLKPNLLEPVQDIALLYREKKRKLQTLDYDDLLYLWLTLLEQKPIIKKTLSQKFQYILVDEYQDTNHLQANIIQKLVSVHGNILVVGDDAQSIYSFRAADITNILSFPKTYTGTNMYKLETNYRSTPEILALANSSITNNLEQFPKTLYTKRTSGQKPKLVPVQNNDQQAEFISQRVIELNELGYNLKDMAVLFRADYHALELELILNRKGIPYIKRGGLKFFEQAHLKDIVSFLKILHNPADEIAWTRILTLIPGIGRVGAQKIINECRGQTFTDIATQQFNFPDRLKQSFQQIQPLLSLLAQIPIEKISELIETVKTNFYFTYLENTYENAAKRQEDIEQLINFADTYNSLEQFLSDTSLSENFQVETRGAEPHIPDDYLILSTIHQAKGLEWPVVFILNLISGQFPHARSMDSQEEFEEERRLFYVAVTRTQDELYLVYPIVSYNHSYGLIFTQPSEFIQELPPDLYEQWQIETDSDEKIIEYLPDV